MQVNKPDVSIENISKWYPNKKASRKGLFGPKSWIKAVDNVSLKISRGEILGIIGESGCGKSTMGRLLTRLEAPTAGDVFLDGVSTSNMVKKDNLAFRRQVQIVFQNPFDTFTPRDTIRQILMRPLNNHNIGDSAAERLEICRKALDSSGLRPADDILARYPHELSGGQLQRISILRSMLLNPSFIIADEPVSMLDMSVRADIVNMLVDLARVQNAAVVFISHDIALTRYISDTVAVMYLGRIVEYGKTEDVLHHPLHPYTQALLSNCTSIDPDDQREMISIEGEPPTPIDPGPGCYFAPRCIHACSECTKAYPDMVEMENGHTAACRMLSSI